MVQVTVAAAALFACALGRWAMPSAAGSYAAMPSDVFAPALGSTALQPQLAVHMEVDAGRPAEIVTVKYIVT